MNARIQSEVATGDLARPARLAPLLLAALALTPPAAASDALVIARGQLVVKRGPGITAGPLAGSQLGDSFTFVASIDAPPTGSPSTGSVQCESDWRVFYLQVGSASLTESYASQPGTATVGNDVVDPGAPPYDLLIVGRPTAEQGSPTLFHVDRTSTDFSTNDITQLTGTYVQSFPDAHLVLHGPWVNSGFLCRVDSLEIVQRSQFGQQFCTQATPNSTGNIGRMTAEGFDHAFANELVLRGTGLPIGQFSLLVCSRSTTLPQAIPGSMGLLCVGGSVGRLNSQIRLTGVSSSAPGVGTVVFRPDLDALPQPTGAVQALSGETWTFQAWHRDVVGGAVTSNLTTAVAVTLR